MTFGSKNTTALHAYIAALSGLKLGEGFFAKLNFEYSRLTIELFKCLFQTNALERKYEFLHDLKMFIDDMIRKYSTTSPYGYSPRSPYEKRMGIKPSFTKSKVYARDELDKTHNGMML
ncbi:MAG: hypothetical protein RPR97_16185 [Colwellia sp.]|jgi:hypothetical protein